MGLLKMGNHKNGKFMRPTRKMISLNGSITTNVEGMGNLCPLKRKSTIRIAIVLFFALCMINGQKINAQVSAYTFAQSSGAYNEITGGSVIGSSTDDDQVYGSMNIGFTFNYNGTAYTQFGLNTNGWISLGSAVPSSSTSPIDIGSTNNIICGIGKDLVLGYRTTGTTTSGSNVLTAVANTTGAKVGSPISGTGIPAGTTITAFTANTITISANATANGTGIQFSISDGETRYETIGTAPNRILVVQWTRARRYSTTSSQTYNEVFNFQIRLKETSDIIEIVYGSFLVNATSTVAEVGLRGASNSDYNNRTTTTNWASTTAGGTNAAICTLSNTIYPSSGNTYTFTPSSCYIPTAVSSSSVTATTATISWTAPAPAPSNGYTYEIRTSGAAGSGATGLATSGSTAAGVTSANISGLTASTTYYVYVRSYCGGSNYSSWTSSYSFTTLIAACTTPAVQPTLLTLSSITATGLSGSFTAASPAPSGYLVVRSTSSSLSSNPIDATTYSAGNALGGGTVVQVGATTNFTESSLTANTRYYYYIFSYNNTSCSGGPKYYTTSPLQNDATTCPNTPTSPTTTSVTSTGFTLGWTAPANGATDYTVDISLTNFGASIASFPSTTASTSLAVTGLSSATTYYYRIRSNNSSCSSAYTTVGSITTACTSVTTFPYTESFGASIPACWSVSEAVSGASIHWAPTTADATHGASAPKSGTHFMFLNVYNALATKNPYYLTTGNFALNDTIKKLSYYYFLGASGNTTSPIPMEVEISTNGGTSWTSLYQHTSSNSTMSAWTLNTIDLSAYINQTITLRFASNSNYGSSICNQGIDEFVIENSTPMTYISCTTTQNNTDAVPRFTSDAEIIGIQVVTTGTLNPISASYFSFLTTGSTNALVDIGTANVYYTGNSKTFAATNKFGSTKMQPNGRFSFTGTQQLTADTNYFWLAYDIPLTATLGNILDAQCDTVTVTSVRTPSSTNPNGSRTIGNVVIMNDNPETVCYANFYDNGGANGNYTNGVDYSKTFIPDAGKVIKISFSSFNTSEVADSLTIYDGPSDASPVIGKYYGAISPGTVIASNTGELTLSFKSNGMTNSAGWNALVTCVSLPPNCATLSTPANNASNQPTNTPITWISGLPDLTHQAATSYKLYFGTDAAATNIHNGTNIGNATSWGMMLDTSTTYYWKIVPVNASGEATGCTTIHSFRTANTFTRTTYNVPGDYATIKAAYNACTAAFPYIINVTTGYTGESYPIALNADVASVVSNRSASNPIVIRPGATFSYTFAGAANKVFEFSGGANYITIDGRQGGTGAANSFIFTNTSSTLPVINFTGDNSCNTIQYCKIQGNNQSSGIINLTSPSGNGIRNITIDNNEITKNTGNPTDGILTEGTNALKNTKIAITNNKIYDIYADVASSTHGIFFGYNEFNYNCAISGNSIYLTSDVTPSSNNIKWYGMVIKGNNHTVANNYVGGKAANCGGAALTILGNKENQICGISVKGTLASSTTTVSGNTVNNISLSTRHRTSDNITQRAASSSNQTFAGIVIENGGASVNNNNIGGTAVGSIKVINTNTSNPSTVNDGSNWGYSAELVGIVYNSKLGTINNSGNIVQGLWCFATSSATNNLNSRVIGILASTDNASNTGYFHKITNNTIGGTGGLKAGNGDASDAFVYGILSVVGRGTIHIKNNTVSNLWVNGSGDYGYLRGIHNNGGIRAEIQNNTISNLVCAANNNHGVGADIRNKSLIGLISDNDGGDCDYFFLIKNTVYDLRSTAATATINAIGLYYRHNVSPVYGRVYGNKIYSINASTTDTTSKLIGMWAYGQNTITYNNMISLGNNVSTAAGASCPNTPLNSGNYELIGIENNYGKNEYYYNTINIVGTSTGGSNTYAYKYVNSGTESLTRVFRNNIFSNTRSSTSGTQKNYAFSVSLNETYGRFTSDYNYFYVSGTNGILFDDFGAPRTTIAAWTASSGKDANSTGTGVLSPADPLFVAPCNCDCNLDITDIASPIVGTGSTIGVPTFILDDYNNFSRNSTNNVGAVIVGANTLPIELLSFTGQKFDKVTKLEWITSTEINNDRFTVERSIDGIHFEPIATVKGAGNSNSAIKYEVLDENPLNGINYYRLKQTDYDGAFSYSLNIVAINYSNDAFLVQVYPNPFNQKINVNLTGIDDEEAQISIYDIAGKQIYRQSINNAGNTFQIELESNIPNGVYFMTVQVANTIKHIKIIKSNR